MKPGAGVHSHDVTARERPALFVLLGPHFAELQACCKRLTVRA